MKSTVSGRGGVFSGVDDRGNTVAADKVKQGTDQWMNKNFQTTMHLSGAQKASTQMGVCEAAVTCYIYNTSPVFEHQRRADGFGTFLITRAPKVGSKIIDKDTGKERKATAEDIAGDYRLNLPIVINHSYVRSFDAGENKRTPYVEYGMDIAQDLVGCSKRYPPDLVSTGNQWDKNLLTWGVFITYGKPFEELEPEDRAKLLETAENAHISRCIEKVNKGDILHEKFKVKGAGGPLEIHRQCALYLGETVSEDYTDRPWVTNRGNLSTLSGKVDCEMCGSKVKATVAKCPACGFIIDPDKYERLTAKKPAKKEKSE